MKTSCSLASLAVVCTLIGAGPAAAVVTLGDGSYDIAFSVSENGTDFAGTASVSASLDAVASGTLTTRPALSTLTPPSTPTFRSGCS